MPRNTRLQVAPRLNKFRTGYLKNCSFRLLTKLITSSSSSNSSNISEDSFSNRCLFSDLIPVFFFFVVFFAVLEVSSIFLASTFPSLFSPFPERLFSILTSDSSFSFC